MRDEPFLFFSEIKAINRIKLTRFIFPSTTSRIWWVPGPTF